MMTHNLGAKSMSRVTQKEINQIAAFVEACLELEREPFFGRDEKLSVRNDGKRWTFTFGDRFHFRSALISFRRLWMQKEPSNWEKIAALLKTVDLPSGAASVVTFHKDNIRRILRTEKHWANLNMASDRIIDLWLNTVFAHGGLEGPNKRSDFEATVDLCGHAVFEYSFRSLVDQIGSEFLNISKLAAKPTLDYCKQTFGLSPTFRLGAAFGAKRKEKTSEGHIIIREGSSEFFSEETMEERFIRILQRSEHKEIQFVFKNLEVTERELLLAVLRYTNLTAILESFDGRLELKAFKPEEIRPPNELLNKCLRASWAINRSRIHVLEDCVVATDEKGVGALNAALTKFRKQLLEQ